MSLNAVNTNTSYNAHDFIAMRNELSKKNFESVMNLSVLMLTNSPAFLYSSEFQSLFRRAFTVLKTRCSDQDVAFWKAFLQLSSTAQRSASHTNDNFLQEVSKLQEECQAVLLSNTDQPTPLDRSIHSNTSLFEGQLTSSEADQHRSNQQGAHQALITAELAALIFGAHGLESSQEPSVLTEENTIDDNNDNEDTTTTTETSTSNRILPNGAHLSPEMAQALERELDNIAIALMEETGNDAIAHQQAPPASKKVVATLPKQVITAETLKQLGGDDARCPVCMCLEIGDEILMLPCKHYAHPECMKPWLRQTNSCPTCRHALPTDDFKYEERKERARDEEETRKGAENAIKNDEFLYI